MVKLVTDLRMPPDLRIIMADPRWCLTMKDADNIAIDMAIFMDKLRLSEPPPRMAFDPDLPPARKRANRPLPFTHPNEAEEAARVVAESYNVRSNSPHVSMGARVKFIGDKTTRCCPTILIQDIVRILVEAARVGL